MIKLESLTIKEGSNEMKKGFLGIMVLIIFILSITIGCAKPTVNVSRNPSIANETVKSENTYKPDENSESFKAALDALETTDKYLNLTIDLKNKIADPKYDGVIEGLKSNAAKLFNLYAERIELCHKKLGALYIIDINKESDARIPAYTDVLQVAVASVSFDAQTNITDPEIAVKMGLDLYKSRNKLAVIMGKETIVKE